MIIRKEKAVSNTIMPNLESSAAWLLKVCRARILIRFVTTASDCCPRVPNNDQFAAQSTALGIYDGHSEYSNSAGAMLELIKMKSFLNFAERQLRTLANVPGASTENLKNESVQDLFLNIENHGNKTAEIHAPVVFPEVFGALSED